MKIRTATLDDAAAIAEIYAPYIRDTVISFEFDAPDADEMRGRMAQTIMQYPWLAAEEDARIVGYVQARPHGARAAYQWSADVGVYLHADYHRRGLGRRMYAILFDILRRQGYHSLYAGITLPNDASVGLHRVMGMSEIGVYREVGFKFGAWRDVLDMGLSFAGDALPTAPPIPFAALGENDFDGR